MDNLILKYIDIRSNNITFCTGNSPVSQDDGIFGDAPDFGANRFCDAIHVRQKCADHCPMTSRGRFYHFHMQRIIQGRFYHFHPPKSIILYLPNFENELLIFPCFSQLCENPGAHFLCKKGGLIINVWKYHDMYSYWTVRQTFLELLAIICIALLWHTIKLRWWLLWY